MDSIGSSTDANPVDKIKHIMEWFASAWLELSEISMVNASNLTLSLTATRTKDTIHH